MTATTATHTIMVAVDIRRGKKKMMTGTEEVVAVAIRMIDVKIEIVTTIATTIATIIATTKIETSGSDLQVKATTRNTIDQANAQSTTTEEGQAGMKSLRRQSSVTLEAIGRCVTPDVTGTGVTKVVIGIEKAPGQVLVHAHSTATTVIMEAVVEEVADPSVEANLTEVVDHSVVAEEEANLTEVVDPSVEAEAVDLQTEEVDSALGVVIDQCRSGRTPTKCRSHPTSTS